MTTSVFRWEFGIGDPTFVGWSLTLVYLLAAFLVFRVSIKIKKTTGVETFYSHWLLLSLLLLFFSLNKQLDLQTLISDIGRWIATSLDLMEQRHIFKRVFIISLFLFMAIPSYCYRKSIKQFMWQFKMTSSGLIIFILFIVCRASSFHLFSDGFNEILNRFSFFTFMEFISLLIIIVSTLNLKEYSGKQTLSIINKEEAA